MGDYPRASGAIEAFGLGRANARIHGRSWAAAHREPVSGCTRDSRACRRPRRNSSTQAGPGGTPSEVSDKLPALQVPVSHEVHNGPGYNSESAGSARSARSARPRVQGIQPCASRGRLPTERPNFDQWLILEPGKPPRCRLCPRPSSPGGFKAFIHLGAAKGHLRLFHGIARTPGQTAVTKSIARMVDERAERTRLAQDLDQQVDGLFAHLRERLEQIGEVAAVLDRFRAPSSDARGGPSAQSPVEVTSRVGERGGARALLVDPRPAASPTAVATLSPDELLERIRTAERISSGRPESRRMEYVA